MSAMPCKLAASSSKMRIVSTNTPFWGLGHIPGVCSDVEPSCLTRAAKRPIRETRNFRKGATVNCHGDPVSCEGKKLAKCLVLPNSSFSKTALRSSRPDGYNCEEHH